MRAFILALTVFATLSLAACETTKGLGRDITNAGEAVQNRM